MQPRAFRAGSRRQSSPSGLGEHTGDALRRAGNPALGVPGAEVMRSVDAEHIALTRTPQRHLDIANPIDGVGRHPGEGDIGGDRVIDHLARQVRLGGEGRA